MCIRDRNKTVPEILRELSNLKFPIVLPALGGGVIDKASQYLTEETEVRETDALQRQSAVAPNGVWETEFVKLHRKLEGGRSSEKTMELINKLDRGVNLWGKFSTGDVGVILRDRC